MSLKTEACMYIKKYQKKSCKPTKFKLKKKKTIKNVLSISIISSFFKYVFIK